MNAPPSPSDIASPRERERLEQAHHEICTALTVLRSNVELVRIELRGDPDAPSQVVVQRHLGELDLAVERLRRLALQMRAWHENDSIDPGGTAQASSGARLLPLERQ